MMNFLARYTDTTYAIMRIASGALFSFHGMQKIFGLLAEHETAFLSQMWFGGIIELVCGLLLVAGFQTRPAAFLASGTMAVAYIQFHWAFQMGPKFFPALNGGDGALLYAFMFLYIACQGAGQWALDKEV